MQNFYKSALVFLFLIVSSLAYAQTAQTIRGKVVDAQSTQPLSGASIRFFDTQGQEFGTVTDEVGGFRLEKQTPGRYDVEVTFVGYKPYSEKALLLTSGKELVLTIEMQAAEEVLAEVVVGSSRMDFLPTVSQKEIRVEETFRYAASFYDPARLATSFAGVSVQNDQNNNLIIRGNSPNYMLWRLEGVDIVNPNHLANAGTFADRPVQNGGGTNILSAQMLDNSSFFTGNFSADYGNAISGVFDMRLRKGNNERREFTAQASLIGIDLAAEGPMFGKKGASFLMNYRYSFVGILTGPMGLDFGGEEINFQDFSFNFSLPSKKLGDFTFFGMAGASANLFEADLAEEAESEKDFYSITYRSRMTATGLTHRKGLSENSSMHTTVALSTLRWRRNQQFLGSFEDDLPMNYVLDKAQEDKLSFHSRYQSIIKAGTTLKAGVSGNFTFFEYQNRPDTRFSPNVHHLATQQGLLLQPYFSVQNRLRRKWDVQLGLHLPYYAASNELLIEPRFRSTYLFSQKTQFYAAVGLHSQIDQTMPALIRFNHLQNTNNPVLERSIPFVRSFQSSVGQFTQLTKGLSLNTELYYQYTFNIPNFMYFDGLYSSFNSFETLQLTNIHSMSDAQTYGVEVELKKDLQRGFYSLVNATLFRSQISLNGQDWLSSRYDSRFAWNATLGKDFHNRKGKDKTFGVHARLIHTGGLRDYPVNGEISEFVGYTFYDREQGLSEQLPDYFRLDLRLMWRKNKAKFNQMLSLDIQNATNRRNAAFRVWDNYLNKVVLVRQLGIIPLLTYRVEF